MATGSVPEVATAPDEGAVVVVARVAGAFGVDGRVKVRPYAANPELLTRPGTMLIRDARGGNWAPFPVRGGAVHGEHVLLVVDGVTQREQAAALRGRDLGVPRSALPPTDEDEVYLVDLLGARVERSDGSVIGTIEGFLEVGDTQVARIRPDRGGDGGEVLIPLVPEYVVEMELPQRKLVVDWPE